MVDSLIPSFNLIGVTILLTISISISLSVAVQANPSFFILLWILYFIQFPPALWILLATNDRLVFIKSQYFHL